MKKVVLVAALGSVLAGCSVAQTTPTANAGLEPRDPPYGKGNAGNDTMNQAGGSTGGQGYGTSSYPIPPRDPPYGKSM